MKYLIHLWLIILFVNCASSHVNKGIVLFEKNTEICVCSNPHFQESTAYLAQKLESLLKKKIRVSTKCADNELCIQLVKTKDNQTLFKLYATEKGMVLESGTVQGIQNAVHYFLIHVLGFIPYDHKVSMLKFDKISIPKDYSYSAPKPSFDYREPYFIENYKTDFRKIHQTHTLENT